MCKTDIYDKENDAIYASKSLKHSCTALYLSKLYDNLVGFVLSSFEDVYCFLCGRRRLAVAQYRMIRPVLSNCVIIILMYSAKTCFQIFFTLLRRGGKDVTSSLLSWNNTLILMLQFFDANEN